MRVFFVLLSLFLSNFILAQIIPAGEYNSEGGEGVLTIGKTVNGQTPYSFYTVGVNGHICEGEGSIQNGKAKNDLLSSGTDVCQIDFKRTKGKVTLTVADRYSEACRASCGSRAWFTGDYIDTPQACTNKAMKARQQQGQMAYQQKKYNQARNDLGSVLNQCKKFLSWRMEGSLRNDLALVEAKRGNKAGCWTALQPYLKDMKLPDEDVQLFDAPAPLDHEHYLQIIKAARVNAKWCERTK